jgi:Tfp pilus assembly protein PilO
MKNSMLKAVIILAVCMAAVLFGVVLPTILSLQKASATISDARILIERQYQQRQTLRETVAHLQAVRGETSTFGDYAIREGAELDFIQALEHVAGKYRIDQEIELITVNQTDVTTWEKEIPIMISLQGTFPDVLRYLRGVEQLPYVLRFEDLRFTSLVAGAGRASTRTASGAVDVQIIGYVRWISAAAPDFAKPL